MLLVSKAISQLLLPPGGLILLGLAGVICWKRWWGRGAVALSLLLLWGLSTEPVRDALTEPLEFQYPALKTDQIKTDGTVIVLLGGGIHENAPEYGGSNVPGRYAMMRTIYAAEVARQSGMEVYATGGRPLTQADEAEGEIMRQWLLKLGLQEGHAHAETASNNTWENAAYMKKILAAKGVGRVVLVTSAWHMPRAVWCFESHGFEVVPAPVDYLTEQESYDLRSYLPHWTIVSDSGQALHEYLGLLWYRLRYRQTGD
ncbi:MAG: YdcF family protein [Mariprofundaceae bacterium]|nr:YdcF family protein [Mariprofundaceae bacterium]